MRKLFIISVFGLFVMSIGMIVNLKASQVDILNGTLSESLGIQNASARIVLPDCSGNDCEVGSGKDGAGACCAILVFNRTEKKSKPVN